jgi:hypothetical protein
MVDHPLGGITDMANDIQKTAGTFSVGEAGKRPLVDARQGTMCDFKAFLSFSPIGFGFDSLAVQTTALDRFVMPRGHNLDGYNIRLQHDVSMAFSTATTVVNSDITGSAVIDEQLTSSSTARYWRFYTVGISGDEFQIHGVWIGVYEQMSSSAMIGSGFSNFWETQTNRTEYPSGTAVVELSPPRRKFSLKVSGVDPASADYTLLDKVLLNGRARSFWYWPPDDTDAGPFLVRLDGDGSRDQESSAPSVNIRYRFDISMTEQLI